ncbi:MAG: AEC family transporter [Clostridiales bacterium]|nr:AEC family transporter [Clostridiales bacterium]
MSFTIALSNVLLTLLYIIPGFIICKMKKVRPEHLSTMSAVLIYVCSPCMVINSFLQIEFSWSGFTQMVLFFAVTLVLQIAFMLILYAVCHRKYGESKYRILTIGAVFGNVGFFGLPVVKAILPANPEVMCYSSIFVLSMNLLVFTIGVFCLTNDKKYMTLKSAILNPTTFSILVALPLYFFGVRQYMPDLLTNAFSLLSSMTTPLCMIILGIRLATVSLKKLFTRPIIYLICALKLIVFPLFCFAAVYFLPLDFAFKASILILTAVPCASILLNMAEIHHSETELAANCVLVSTLLCFLTIPVLVLLL